MYFLYTILTALGTLLLLPYFAYLRWRRGKHFHGLADRLGFLPPSLHAAAGPAGQAIWIHAVSVGEVLAATAFVAGIRRRFPGRRLVISTTTPAGQALALERFGALAGPGAVFYFPLDWPFALSRAFRAVRPAVVAIMETEIWPNFLRQAQRRGVPVVFVNGRISARSFARTQRWQWLAGGFFRRVLHDARLFLMQSEEDRERILALGADPASVQVTGNLKYDVAPPAPGPLVAWLQQAGAGHGPILVAGSVVAGEEEPVLDAFACVRERYPGALLVLAPRKPDRFEAAADILARRGFPSLRRSGMDLAQPLPEGVAVLLLDTVGELAAVYRVAAAVFVGGSLVPAGGHNILEPAASGRPPIFGPHMDNFREMAAEFRSSGAGFEVRSGSELGRCWLRLLDEQAAHPGPSDAESAARGLVERNQGATERTLDALLPLFSAPAPGLERRVPLRSVFLRPLAPLYGFAAWLRAAAYRRGLVRSQHLPATVISVGNLTVGGTGKTPFVAWLAEQIQREGRSVAVLSRGYRGFGRGSANSNGTAPGDSAGLPDEAALLRGRLPSGIPVVIGANRYRAAQPLVSGPGGVNCLVLDDGFQHLQLHRDVDVVLVDATDPFGGGLLPAGRAREPRSALQRADVLVITRSERAPGLEAALRRFSQAPIFYAQTVWDQLVAIEGAGKSGEARVLERPAEVARTGVDVPAAPDGQPRYFAFCGIGNPEAFFADLQRWSAELRGSICGERAFPDHHLYSAGDLNALEQAAADAGSTALLCTEKDARNLPFPLSLRMPLFACRIRLLPADGGALLRAILEIAARRAPHRGAGESALRRGATA
jgi:tetraacyldisaccharide 4'-kinase